MLNQPFKTLFLSLILFLTVVQAWGGSDCESLFAPFENRENGLVDKLTIGAVLFPIEYNQTKEAVLNKIENQVNEAVAAGSKWVVFPELIALDLLKTLTHESDASQLYEIAKDFFPSFERKISELSKTYEIVILGGSAPRLENGEIRNTAVLGLPDGRVIFQDKLFLTPDEIGWGWSPGKILKIIDTPDGRAVILTCFDCEFPLLSHLIAPHRPELILVPSMTGNSHGFKRVRWSAQARAIEHHAYVIHTGTVGRGAGKNEFYGQASIITPNAPGFKGIQGESPPNERFVLVDELNLDQLRKSRLLDSTVYPARQQKLLTEELSVEVIQTRGSPHRSFGPRIH